MHVMRRIHAQKNLELLLRHNLPRRSGGVPWFRSLRLEKAMITLSKNRILAVGVLVTAVTLLVLSSTARPVLGRADEQAKSAGPAHYSVVMTEAHNLLVTDNATCKRVSGIIGPLYLHKNMKKTHKLLHYYFGWGSVSILAQVGKFFEYERLVSADGANVYVTDENILRNLHMPIGLLHGNRNQVFDPESSERTLARINNIHRENCTLLPILGDYAHFDCLAGDRAYKDVFPSISDFLQGHVL